MALWMRRAAMGWATARSAAVNSVLQSRCVGCGAWGGHSLCPACFLRLEALPPVRCSRCGGSLGRGSCPLCEPDPPPFSGVTSLGRYAGVLRKAVRALKYEARLELGVVLGIALAERLEPAAEGWLVVPVPLSGSRWRERGFNQAEAIARSVSRARGWAHGPEALVRRVAASPLYRMGREARWQTLAGAFQARGEVVGRRVLVVDDVLTTGATASHCASALLSAGALEVRVAVVARAVMREAQAARAGSGARAASTSN